MQLIPNSNREDNAPTHHLRLREFNKCHNPSGAGGGRFCSMGPDQAYPRYPYVPTAAGRLLEGYPDKEVAAQVRQARTRLTKKTAETGHEYMAVVQPGEHMLVFTSNERSYVEYPDGLFESLQKNPAHFAAHTHPTDSAPSLPDIRAQAKSKIPKGLVFTPSGDWYEVTITDFDRAKAVIGQGRRPGTYWEKGTEGKFATEFNRLKKQASNAAMAETDAWIAKQTGWTPVQDPGGKKKGGGFMTPDGYLNRTQAANKAGSLGIKGFDKDAIIDYHITRFGEHSPQIWLTLAEKHKDWMTFRYSRKRGPHANR
jgi:hypothetical protein